MSISNQKSVECLSEKQPEDMTIRELMELRDRAAKVSGKRIKIEFRFDREIDLEFDGVVGFTTCENLISKLTELATPKPPPVPVVPELPEKRCGKCKWWKLEDHQNHQCTAPAPAWAITPGIEYTSFAFGKDCKCFAEIVNPQSELMPPPQSDKDFVLSRNSKLWCKEYMYTHGPNTYDIRVGEVPNSVTCISYGVYFTPESAWKAVADQIREKDKKDELDKVAENAACEMEANRQIVLAEYPTAICVKMRFLWHVTIGHSGWMGKATEAEAWKHAADDVQLQDQNRVPRIRAEKHLKGNPV